MSAFHVPKAKSKSCWPGAAEAPSAVGRPRECSDAPVVGTAASPSAARTNVMIQFASHVRPPSAEYACSKRLESGVMSEKVLRTSTLLPSITSWSKNSPRPRTNCPYITGCSCPFELDVQLRLHCPDCGL